VSAWFLYPAENAGYRVESGISAIKNKAAGMILKVVVEDQAYPVTVPDDIVRDAEDFFSKLDRDMDRGWQMSRDWVDNPNLEQRCQIVGDKMLTALHNNDQRLPYRYQRRDARDRAGDWLTRG
jgi:hypothetical protein